MQRVRMLEKQAAWKRESGFKRIEIIAVMYEQTLRRLHVGFDSEPLYTVLYYPRWLPTSEEFYVGNERRGKEIEDVNFTFAATTATAI